MGDSCLCKPLSHILATFLGTSSWITEAMPTRLALLLAAASSTAAFSASTAVRIGRRPATTMLRSSGSSAHRQAAAVVMGTPDAEGPAASAVRRYFAAWNVRDMETAVSQFADECEYDDTQYDSAFTGKAALEAHLNRVADALPPTFQFVVDEVADGGELVGVQWHVENGGVPLPFTRGCSMYRADPATGLLLTGFDVPEPAPLKPGSASLRLLGLASKIIAEPIRALPLTLWGLYVTIVFFSNGILPGPDATQLDPATWEEVKSLSINFWQIAPALGLPFAPVLHPGLEAIFNTMLVWAACWAGFLVDGRPGRPHGSFLPTVIGMQALTNAFLLPYLAYRSSEAEGTVVYEDEVDGPTRAVGESRALGPVLAGFGAFSIAWGLFARPEFGDIPTRLASLGQLLSTDRLGSSFVIDLVLFSAFQGWLVDEDLSRRGVAEGESTALRAIAKFVPLFGLCAYQRDAYIYTHVYMRMHMCMHGTWLSSACAPYMCAHASLWPYLQVRLPHSPAATAAAPNPNGGGEGGGGEGRHLRQWPHWAGGNDGCRVQGAGSWPRWAGGNDGGGS